MKITPSAIEEIKKNAQFLQINVEIGGCNGFYYTFDYTNIVQTQQILIENYLLIQPYAQELLKTITLDFIDELGKKEFVIINPAAKNKCGCGNSFNI